MKTIDEFLQDVNRTPGFWFGRDGDGLIRTRDAEHADALKESQQTANFLRAELRACQDASEAWGKEREALRAQLDRAVDWLRLVVRSPKSFNPLAIEQFLRDFAAPSHPEPVKASYNITPALGGLHGSESTTNAPVFPENAGTTCPACRGLKVFDEHGNPAWLANIGLAIRALRSGPVAEPGAFRCPHRACHLAGAIPCNDFLRNKRQNTRWTP